MKHEQRVLIAHKATDMVCDNIIEAGGDVDDILATMSVMFAASLSTAYPTMQVENIIEVARLQLARDVYFLHRFEGRGEREPQG